MQYNDTQYNNGEYDLTASVLSFSETLTETDTVTKQATTTRIESQPSVDAIGDAESLAAFLETVTILQHATYGNVYNSTEYNAAMYNRTVDQDEVLLQATKALTDIITSSDTMQPFSIIKGLFETISDIDTIIFSGSFTRQDFVFLDTFMKVEISNKALSDIIRTNDWLSIKKIEAGEWYN